MYSQYIDSQFHPFEERRQQKTNISSSNAGSNQEKIRSNSVLGDLTGGISQFLGGLGKQFNAGQFDTGDILLVLIILFLFLEGDNLELVITLGLMLLLGFNDDQSTL